MTKLNPFDFVNSITEKGQRLDPSSGYVPFLTNRALSYHKDCVLWVNEVNTRYSMPEDMQYEFLYGTISKKKRFGGKWAKQQKDEDIELISQYYQVNIRRAAEILSLINKDELENIKSNTFKGGRI